MGSPNNGIEPTICHYLAECTLEAERLNALLFFIGEGGRGSGSGNRGPRGVFARNSVPGPRYPSQTTFAGLKYIVLDEGVTRIGYSLERSGSILVRSKESCSRRSLRIRIRGVSGRARVAPLPRPGGQYPRRRYYPRESCCFWRNVSAKIPFSISVHFAFLASAG